MNTYSILLVHGRGKNRREQGLDMLQEGETYLDAAEKFSIRVERWNLGSQWKLSSRRYKGNPKSCAYVKSENGTTLMLIKQKYP